MSVEDLLRTARQAAQDVSREARPTLWARWVAWRREGRCAKGHHVFGGWKKRGVTHVFDPLVKSDRPIEVRQTWEGACVFCSGPTAKRVKI